MTNYDVAVTVSITLFPANQLTYLSQLVVGGHLLPALGPAALADLLGDLGERLGQLVLGQRLLPRLHVVGQVAVVALEARLELLVIRYNCHKGFG